MKIKIKIKTFIINNHCPGLLANQKHLFVCIICALFTYLLIYLFVLKCKQFRVGGGIIYFLSLFSSLIFFLHGQFDYFSQPQEHIIVGICLNVCQCINVLMR